MVRLLGIAARTASLVAWITVLGAAVAWAQDPSAGPSRSAPPAAVVPTVPPTETAPPAVLVPPATVTTPDDATPIPPGSVGVPPESTEPAVVPPTTPIPPGSVVVPAPTPPLPEASTPSPSPPPSPTTVSTPVPAEPFTLDEPEPEPIKVVSNPFRAALQSIFGRTDPAPWHPLPLGTLFNEGWDEPWIGPPNGARGGPRQGWIDSADGNFYRLWFFSYTYTNTIAGGGNGHLGSFTHYQPLSRRLSLITEIPFVTANIGTLAVGKQVFPNPSTSPAHANAVGFGDLAFTPRVMLHETDNVSLVSQLTVQVPTGYRPSANGLAVVTPGIQFWANVAPRWVVRGGFNVAIGTNPQAGGTTLVSQLAAGRTFTPHDVPLFGDFTTYLATNTFNNLETGRTTFELTPGFRTHLGDSYYCLAGINVPVTGPRPYAESAIFWIMKVY